MPRQEAIAAAAAAAAGKIPSGDTASIKQLATQCSTLPGSQQPISGVAARSPVAGA